jgi:hypothetical protein
MLEEIRIVSNIRGVIQISKGFPGVFITGQCSFKQGSHLLIFLLYAIPIPGIYIYKPELFVCLTAQKRIFFKFENMSYVPSENQIDSSVTITSPSRI